MTKPVVVLQSRVVAEFAAKNALATRGIIAGEFVMDSFSEVKRSRDRRFAVLNFKTQEGATAQVAVRLVKSEDRWQSAQTKVLAVSNAPQRRLGYMTVRVDTANAVDLIRAFCRPFPSLGGIDPLDVIRVVTRTRKSRHVEGHPEHQEAARAMKRIQAAIEESSYDQWPAKMSFKEESSWTLHNTLTLTPYVGDRSITISGGLMGQGHGEGSGYINITVDSRFRPSAHALRHVIRWLRKDGAKWNPWTLWADAEFKDDDFSLFMDNKSIAQYHSIFGLGQAPYHSPREYSEYSLTDWLVKLHGVLAMAEMHKDEARAEKARVEIRQLTELAEDFPLDSAAVKAIIAEHLTREEPVYTEASRLKSATEGRAK